MNHIDIYTTDDIKYQTIYPSRYDRTLTDLLKYIPERKHPFFRNKKDIEYLMLSTEVYVTPKIIFLDDHKHQVNLHNNIDDFQKLYVVFDYDYWHYSEWREVKLKPPEENLSIDECRRVIMEDPFSIILMKNRSTELCKFAIKYDWQVFEHIPEIKYDADMHIFAVECNGSALKHIPYDMRTEYLCCCAVKQHPLLLEYVPEHNKTVYICTDAVLQNGFAIQHVPSRLREYTYLCILALEYDGRTLKCIPVELRTKHIYERALTSSYKSFQYIGEAEQTDELCEFALRINAHALKWFSDKMKTSKMCTLAVTLKGTALVHIPKHQISRALCDLATQSDGMSLKYVPPDLITYKMCMNAVSNSPYALKYVPVKMKTYEICVAAYNKINNVISYVPNDIKNKILRSRL
jgi:hypothetical protein